MVVIGIDPHKGSHTAVAIDEDEHKLDEVRVRADRRQLEALRSWATAFPERSWAIESANGLGRFCPSSSWGRARRSSTSRRRCRPGCGSWGRASPRRTIQTMRYPWPSAACARTGFARWRQRTTSRCSDFYGTATRTSPRSTPKGVPAPCPVGRHCPWWTRRRLSAEKAAAALSGFRATTAVEKARRDQARDLVGDLRRLDALLKASKRTIVEALSAVPTGLGDLSGVGPVATCIILAHSGDIGRFGSEDNYASYNATAPIEASSGPRKRHRLNPRRPSTQPRHAHHRLLPALPRRSGTRLLRTQDR